MRSVVVRARLQMRRVESGTRQVLHSQQHACDARSGSVQGLRSRSQNTSRSSKTPEKFYESCVNPDAKVSFSTKPSIVADDAKRMDNEYALFITERGVKLEPFHRLLLERMYGGEYELVCGGGSELHPVYKVRIFLKNSVIERLKSGSS
jgi:hypothetical protein